MSCPSASPPTCSGRLRRMGAPTVVDSGVTVRLVPPHDVPHVIELVRETLAEFGLRFGEGSKTDEELARLPEGSAVVFDYSQPREVLPPVERMMLDSMSARVAMAGEPFQLFFTPVQLAEELDWLGLRVVEDLDCAAITARYMAGRSDGLVLRGKGGRMCVAAVKAGSRE